MSVAPNNPYKRPVRPVAAAPEGTATPEWQGTGNYAPAPIAGRNTQAGQNAANQGELSAYRAIQGMPNASTGMDFIAQSRKQGLGALIGAQSTANADDYAGMDEIRNYYRNELADLNGQTAKGMSSVDSQAQYGLKNLLRQHASANAGRGTLGSRQYAGAQGDIVSRSNQDYIDGLIRTKAAGLDQAGKISSGLGDVQARDLSERQFQQTQAESIANLIAKYMEMDYGREARVDLESQSDFDKERGNIRGVVGAIFGGAGGNSEDKGRKKDQPK